MFYYFLPWQVYFSKDEIENMLTITALSVWKLAKYLRQIYL